TPLTYPLSLHDALPILNQEARLHCARAMKFLYLVALLAVLVTMAFARPVVLAVLGQSYFGSIVTIKILAWASIPVFLNHALNVRSEEHTSELQSPCNLV